MSEITSNELVQPIPDIEHLSILLNRFSPFKILRIEDTEIRHSNVLAWLLDPSENHGFGDRFFKDFIQEILKSSENEDKDNLDDLHHKVVLGRFNDINVAREQNNIDILCISETNKFILFIENKFHSGEHGNQLQRYLDVVSSNYSKYICVPVFLSLEGVKPSIDKYFAASYQNVDSVITRFLDILSDRIPNNVSVFLTQYSAIIKEKTMSDQKLQEIARNIYAKHKTAIDYIYSLGNSIDITISADGFYNKYPTLIRVWNNANWLSFISKDMEVEERSNSQWAKGHHAQFWFAPYYGKLKLCLEIGPFDIGKTRLNFLLDLEKNGIPIRPSSKTETGTYTRIWTKTVEIKDWQDREELLDKMTQLYNNPELKKRHEKLVKTIREFQFK